MGVLAPVSVTKGPNGQDIETYQQWNVEAWWDEGRWTLTGTQADSNYKAGLWWQDAQDFKNIVAPAMRTAAANWDKQYQVLDAAKDQVTAAKGQLVGFTGKDADALNLQADNFTRSLDQRAEATDPIKPALLSAADIIDQNFPIVKRWWDKWEQDLANAPKCKFDTEQMMAPMQSMARGVLQASKAIMQGYQTELATPQVTQAPPSATPNGTITPADQTGAADTTTPAASPAAALPGVVTTAGTHTAATNAATANAALPNTAVGSAPGTVVTPGASATATAALPAAAGPAVAGTPAGPTLAGLGSSAVAPSVPSAPAFAPSPVATGGAATMPMLPAAGLAGPALGATGGAATVGSGSGSGSGTGLVPFMPGPGSGSNAGSRAGSRAGTGNKGKHDDERKRQVAISPVSGATPGGARGTRSAAIRPGSAKPINPGVAAGLLGRAAKDAEVPGVVASTRRKASKAAARRAEAGLAQDMFLDEDAWLIDDPGTGVVAAQESPATPAAPEVPTPRDHGEASAVIR